jgi:hypothetical protein
MKCRSVQSDMVGSTDQVSLAGTADQDQDQGKKLYIHTVAAIGTSTKGTRGETHIDWRGLASGSGLDFRTAKTA